MMSDGTDLPELITIQLGWSSFMFRDTDETYLVMASIASRVASERRYAQAQNSHDD